MKLPKPMKPKNHKITAKAGAKAKGTKGSMKCGVSAKKGK